MDYKPTLNLPKTDFPMKADLPKREPLFLDRWQKAAIYRRILEKSRGKKKYILHDGPPYANGNIHIGHALNKTLKDIIVKYKTMRGYDSPYVPGWDCHGLPIEHALFKELKIHKSQISQIEFRKKAHEYAMKFVDTQKEQFKRLGVFGDWDNPYLTLSHEYEEAIMRSFLDLAQKGYIYRGLKPVNWCYKCETALAEAEVEYEDHTSPSIYVKFKLDAGRDYLQDTFLVIWTTTPWTLLANVAVAVHPDLKYAYIKTAKGNLVVGSDLLSRVLEQAGIREYELIKEAWGRELEGLIYTHPFVERKGRVVLADYVSRDEGTGLVHTAPGHGAEDYQTGLKYNLDVIMPVDAKGKFDASTGEFQGLHVYDANKLIMEKLAGIGILLFSSQTQHSYPHCWRCKSAVIFRATKQWFLRIDHSGLRNKLISVIKNDIRWVPEAGRERIAAMVELRPDWCLSRQRYWGVPIPAVVCNGCKEEFLDETVIGRFADYISREGSDSWFKKDIGEFLPVDLQCPHCQGKDFSKGSDILDVWFDSGVSHQAVLKKREELGKATPCDLYLEGSDQHRGWFQSSLIPSMCIDGRPPFKTVLTHGFVVDGEGRKMSKSLGNVIAPDEIIKNYGADILRLWVAASDYNEDIRISKEILTRLSESYRKIRNTARFILSNLYDFNPDSDYAAETDWRKIDRWAIFQMGLALAEIEDTYDKFEFYKAYKRIYDFCNETLSMSYLDMVKGRLYTSGKNSKERRAAQSVLYELLDFLARVTAPVLVFTSEEIWQSMPKRSVLKDVSSAHLLDWPQRKNELFEREAKEMAYFDSFAMRLIPDIAKLLEEKRGKGEIGSSFDAQIKLLTNNEERYKFLGSLKADLCEIFKVSQVEITNEPGEPDAVKSVAVPDIAIKVDKAEGDKCERCWNYSHSVGIDKTHPSICGNCLNAIGGK